jgi:hypothetical protein
MCPRDKREEYEDGKETTLTRLIIRKLPKEYDVAVKSVRDLHRFRAYGKEGDISKITNLEDNTRRNYETEWLPEKMRGRSPPPKERRGASGRMCEGGPWGGTSDESASGWGSPKKCSPDRPSGNHSPGPGKQESSSVYPEESPKGKRPWNRTRRTVKMSGSPSGLLSPNLSAEKDENTFLIRVQKGEKEAKVLFLDDPKSRGWEGPFDMSLRWRRWLASTPCRPQEPTLGLRRSCSPIRLLERKRARRSQVPGTGTSCPRR